MKKTLLLAASVMLMIGCQKNKETKGEADNVAIETEETDNIDLAEAYATFGNEIIAEAAIDKNEMFDKYKSLKIGDTVSVKFRSKINEVCQKKGCWMSMELAEGEESFVKFKDYAFFVPLNAGDQEAIVHGKAFVSEVSVADLKHYAKDEGKSQEEIDKIVDPKVTYGFEADGVLITK